MVGNSSYMQDCDDQPGASVDRGDSMRGLTPKYLCAARYAWPRTKAG